jgi:hypothetical protein
MSVRPTLVFLPCWALGVLSFTHVCTSYIGFPLSNLSSPSANYVKFIHKVRDHKRRPTLVFLPCWALGVLSFTHVCTSYIGFPLSNLSSPSANYVKFIHKVRDHKRKTKFDFRIYHLFLFGVRHESFTIMSYIHDIW